MRNSATVRSSSKVSQDWLIRDARRDARGRTVPDGHRFLSVLGTCLRKWSSSIGGDTVIQDGQVFPCFSCRRLIRFSSVCVSKMFDNWILILIQFCKQFWFHTISIVNVLFFFFFLITCINTGNYTDHVGSRTFLKRTLKHVAMYNWRINLAWKMPKRLNIQMLEYLFYRDVSEKDGSSYSTSNKIK